MKFKLSGNKMINCEIVSPEMSYATFNGDLHRSEMKKIVATLNYGHELLSVYRQYRDNLHIANIVEMVEKLEAVFRKYDYEMFEIKRSEK